MKILAVQRLPQEPLAEWPALLTYPDSALLRDNRPLFLPDYPGEWIARVFPVVRISRLGKSIAPKFAKRYYDALTLGIAVTPPAGTVGADLAQCFDGAWVIGKWVPMPDAVTTVTVNSQAIECDLSQWLVDDTIARLSATMTLKTGDLIAPCVIAPPIPIAADTALEATINQETVLNFNIR